MSFSTVVALDAMGGDNAPGEIVKGAVNAVNERKDIQVRYMEIKTESRRSSGNIPTTPIR